MQGLSACPVSALTLEIDGAIIGDGALNAIATAATNFPRLFSLTTTVSSGNQSIATVTSVGVASAAKAFSQSRVATWALTLSDGIDDKSSMAIASGLACMDPPSRLTTPVTVGSYAIDKGDVTCTCTYLGTHVREQNRNAIMVQTDCDNDFACQEGRTIGTVVCPSSEV